MEFKCPHCHDSGCATRVQGPDDLQYQVSVEYVRELWQCNECDNYFIVEFELKNIVKLVKEENA